MPTDRHGVTHAGSLWLFGDTDKTEAAVKDRSDTSGSASEEERGDLSIAQDINAVGTKAASRAANGKSKLPWPISCLSKLSSGGKTLVLF
jgi:hypothetical protein